MKKAFLVIAILMILTACASSTTQPGRSTRPTQAPASAPNTTAQPAPSPDPSIPEFSPTSDWEIALVEYLTLYTPLFYDVRYVNYYLSGRPYVRSTLNEGFSGAPLYQFKCLIQGETVTMDDVPFLVPVSGFDENNRVKDSVNIAAGFDLIDLDGSGIPMLVIHWGAEAAPDFFTHATVHRFQNGTFERIGALNSWAGVTFYTNDGGEVFLRYWCTVARNIEYHTMHITDGVFTNVILITDWTIENNESIARIHNLSTNEFYSWDDFENNAITLTDMLGTELTPIPSWGDTIALVNYVHFHAMN